MHVDPRDVAFTHRPITAWPWPVTKWREDSRFRVGWDSTLRDLKTEVAKRGASDVIVELDLTTRDVRRDGMLRADARPGSPRIVVTFEDPKHGWVRYRGDRFLSWRDNIRAIALGLEALRKIDRYGMSDGEQYAGFRTGLALKGKVLSTVEAAEFIARNGDDPEDFLRDAELCKSAIRDALRRAHPDHGGTGDQLYAVQAAREVLGQHHGTEL